MYPRLETKKLSDLCAEQDPTRTISTEALFHLRKQFEKFGMLQVHIVLNIRTNKVLGGRKSIQTLRDIGQTEVPVWCIDIAPDEEKIVSLLLQNHWSEYQWRPVSEDLKAMKEKGLSLQLSGFQEYDTNPLASAEWTRVDVKKRVDMDSREGNLFL